MKSTVLFLVAMLSWSALAAEMKLADYDWHLTDIAERGLKKEPLLSSMDTKWVKTKSSICSNRAHIWANDFKTKFNLNTGKIFLFFTSEPKVEGEMNLSLRKTWWYHVAPVINENNQLFVMDAAYSKVPFTISQWTQKFAFNENCREMKASETELIELIFREKSFPRDTVYGHNTCYYKIVPHTIWIPEVLARNLLGVDGSGNPVRVERPAIDKGELYQACLEATAGKIGFALGASKKKCEEYVNASNLFL